MLNPNQKTALCDSDHSEKRQVVTTITSRKTVRSAFLRGRQLLGKGGAMDARDDSSIEGNCQPTVLDNSVLASGFAASDRPVLGVVAYSRQAPSTQSVGWLARENQPRRLLK